MQQENGAGSDWTADRVLALVGHRRYNLPVSFDDAWPPDRMGQLFLRQRLLPRSAKPWPHELWEPVTAALFRELARAPKLAPWLAEFDGQLRRLVEQAKTGEDFRRGLRRLRVSVPTHRPTGRTLPDDLVRLLVNQWTRFFAAAWLPAARRYDERTLNQFRELVKDKRAFVLFTFGSRVPLAPRSALEEIAHNGILRRTKPKTLARKLVARFFDSGSRGVTVKTIKRHTTSSR